MKNTRRITIMRPKWVEDKKTKQLKKIMAPHIVRVNSAITNSHKLCENW